MTSSKYCLKTRDKIKLRNPKKLDSERDHDLFLSKLTTALCCESFDRLPLPTSLGRLPLSELAQELKTGKLISKFEDFDCYNDGEDDESPYVYTCSFVLAIMYFERLKALNPSYLKSINSSELFLISLLVASKFLHDDGELDSAINSEWAEAYGISVKYINLMEKNYLSALNWEFYVSNEEFATRHKEIIEQLYADMQKSSSVLLKVFLLISSVVQKIRKLYRRKTLRQKLKQLVAMSTMFTVMSAAIVQLKTNVDNRAIIQELMLKQIESDPNYPTIPPSSNAQTDRMVNSNLPKKATLKWHSSKLAQLLDYLVLMNTCVSADRNSSYPTVLSETIENKLQNATCLKSLIFFNHLIGPNCTS